MFNAHASYLRTVSVNIACILRSLPLFPNIPMVAIHECTALINFSETVRFESGLTPMDDYDVYEEFSSR